jgi:hypothetical protein
LIRTFWGKKGFQTENKRIMRLPNLELVGWLLVKRKIIEFEHKFKILESKMRKE